MELTHYTELLDAALRSRVTNVRELAELTGRELDVTVQLVEQLEELGFLSVTNELITYRRPDTAVAVLTETLLATLTSNMNANMAQAQGMLATVPRLLEAWSAGATDAHSLHIDVLHGPWAPADMWRLQFNRSVPRVSDVCMPDTSALFEGPVEYMSAFWERRAGYSLDVRLIMSLADATNPNGAARVLGELDSGVQIRMHPKPPSFFWVTDHDTVGVPLEWGQAWPTSVMAIQSPALAAILTWVYDRTWNEAVPVLEQVHPWEPMLKLMSQGLTMDSASHALGLTPRTGRRRVADAMAHYGTSSHFSLGAAWGNSRES